jgi:hypothetical protein
MIQVFSLRAFWLLAISDAASSGAEFLERLALNFFSILLAGGYKIAREVPQRTKLAAALLARDRPNRPGRGKNAFSPA